MRDERPWAPGVPYVLAECATDPVSCNYAPLTAAIYLAAAGGGPALALATASRQGGSSMADGALEVRTLEGEDCHGPARSDVVRVRRVGGVCEALLAKVRALGLWWGGRGEST